MLNISMSKYALIKSRIAMLDELHQLWYKYPKYKFICEAQWVRKKELLITQTLVDQETFIEQCRTAWNSKKEVSKWRC